MPPIIASQLYITQLPQPISDYNGSSFYTQSVEWFDILSFRPRPKRLARRHLQLRRRLALPKLRRSSACLVSIACQLISIKADWKEGFKKKQVGVSDMTLLTTISNESINDNLQKRWTSGEIYTYIGAVLISVNPFRGESLSHPLKSIPIHGTRPRHIFCGRPTPISRQKPA